MASRIRRVRKEGEWAGKRYRRVSNERARERERVRERERTK
jgi:hypothetical protein